MSRGEKIHTIFKSVGIAAAITMGIICVGFGIDMLYKGTTATISTVSFPAALLLLIIGLVLIVVALSRLSKSGIGQNPVRPWLSRNWLVLIGIVVLGTFIATNYKFQPGEKYQVLVSLILITISITAAVGYGIFKWIWANIKGRLETTAEEERNAARAEVQTSLGFIWYKHHELRIKHEGGAKADNNAIDYLSLSIEHAEYALGFANELNETEHDVLICRCKNNLAYYLTERHRKEEHPQDKKRVHVLAQYAYEVAKKMSSSQYIENLAYNWEETYAWVLWQFAGDDQEAKQKAREIVHGLQKRPAIPFIWRESLKEDYAELFKGNN
jgi:hypothetical protein